MCVLALISSPKRPPFVYGFNVTSSVSICYHTHRMSSCQQHTLFRKGTDVDRKLQYGNNLSFSARKLISILLPFPIYMSCNIRISRLSNIYIWLYNLYMIKVVVVRFRYIYIYLYIVRNIQPNKKVHYTRTIKLMNYIRSSLIGCEIGQMTRGIAGLRGLCHTDYPVETIHHQQLIS